MKLVVCLLVSILWAPRVFGQCTGCFNPSFAPSITAFQADAAESFAAGDFDGDGIPDVVVATRDGFGFLRGTGAGRLAPMVHYSSAGSDSIVVADFNGDGRLDVATAGANVSIFLGNGDGTFQAPIVIPPDFYGPTEIVAADFNGDGIPDIALGAFSLSGTNVYFGNGDGTFQPPILLPLGSSVSIGDFNGDGIPDIMSLGPSAFVVALGDGHGGFSSPIVNPTGGTPAAVGDFNGDGLDDIALGNFNGVTIMNSNGDGTFTTGAFYPAPLGLGGIAVGDMNGDGIPDLVLDGYQTGNTYILPGNGDGTFGTATVITQGAQLGAILLQDFDRNGWLDIAILNQNYSVQVLLADSAGHFVVPALYPSGGGAYPSTFSTIATGALTAPGAVDAAVAIIETDLTTQAVSILPGDGSGGFGAPKVVALASVPRWIASGSFHTPGRDDLAVATDVGIQVVLSNGDGTFQTLPPFGGPSAFVVAADFNGDGKIDLAWASSTVQISLGNGDGTFSAPIPVPGSPSGGSIAVGDLNGDHVPDLVVVAGPDVTILLGDGNGGFVVGNTYPVSINVAPTIQIADFDGDGKVDVAVAHGLGYSPVLSVFWGNGDGTLGTPTDVVGNFDVMGILAADVNGDGLPDVVLDGYSSARVFAFHPDRTFSTAGWVTPTIAGFAAIADLDGDGKPEIVSVGNYPPVVGVLHNTICVPSRYVVAQEPSICDTSGVPFNMQPVVNTVDGGDNLMTCNTDTVTAALVSGMGAPGAVLGGQTSIGAVGGVAAFTDLSVDRPGMHYVLDFSGALGSTRSRTFSQDLGVVISGLTTICDGAPAVFRTGSGGYDLYQWTLDGTPVSRAAAVVIEGAGVGPHSLGVLVSADGCSTSTAVNLQVQPSPPRPTIIGPNSVRVGQTGVVGSVTFHEGNTYLWTLAGGTITGGQGSSQIVFDAGPPGTTMVLSVVEASPSGCASPPDVHVVQVDFADASSGSFRDAIDTLARNGISSGCGGGDFCPGAPVTRAQMAVFLLRAEHGAGYVPIGFGQPFIDVPPGSFAAAWINQLHYEGIASGCGGYNYCPDAPVIRAQMAVLLLKTEHGSAYVPPACTGIFADVECSPSRAFAVDWIEQLYHEGVTVGCGGGNFCPDAPDTRGQMAVFLVRAFNLQ
jgi:hypothetical protein